MNADSHSSALFDWFEAQLRRDVDDSRMPYASLLRRLDARIDSDEQHWGACSLLKKCEIPPAGFWERVETNLQRRIAHHDEYEEPVDECIDLPHQLPHNQWERLESKLFSAIDKAEQYPAWEQELRADTILPEGKWEDIENNLMTRLERHDRQQRFDTLSAKPSWPLSFLFGNNVTRGLAVLAALLIASGGSIWRQTQETKIRTYVYQAHGADVDLVGSLLNANSTLVSRPGGAVRIANEHGYAHLQNGARLVVENATRNEARYRLANRDEAGAHPRGAATFFVTRDAGRKRFILATKDYDISVIGTYFRVLPDLGGKMSTEVLEGNVSIHSRVFGDTTLEAGQRLRYDPDRGAYIVESGGPTVARKEIEAMPEIAELEGYVALSVTSNIPFAEVTIDGAFQGATPLRILLAPGKRRIRIANDSYTTVDTTLTIGEDREQHLYATLSRQKPALPRADQQRYAARRSRSAEPEPAKPDTAPNLKEPARKTGDRAREREMLEHAQAIENVDWREAFRLYQHIAHKEGVSSVVRQTALFSIGKLQAERARETEKAKETFMRYLALYPAGTFTREALLRLAELEFETDQDKAIEYYLKYFERYPNHYRVPELQHRVGLMYLQEGKYDEAVYMFKQSLANSIHNRSDMRKRIYTSLHNALVASGDTTQAALVKKRYLTTQQGATAVRRPE